MHSEAATCGALKSRSGGEAWRSQSWATNFLVEESDASGALQDRSVCLGQSGFAQVSGYGLIERCTVHPYRKNHIVRRYSLVPTQSRWDNEL